MDEARSQDDGLVNYSLNRVVGVFDEGTELHGAVDDLTAHGFADSVEAYCGVAGAEEVDFSGKRHGALGRLSRTMHWLTEDKEMIRYEAELRAGHCMVTVHSDDEATMQHALRIMRAHGGRYIHHFGPMLITQLET